MNDNPRKIPIHASLNQANLILGGDRELVLSTMFLAAMIAFTASSWIQIVLGLTFWVLVHSGLVEMARRDPYMRQIIIRHVRYRHYYPAKGGLHALHAEVHKWNI